MKKYYFRYQLINGKTGAGYITAENKKAAMEKAPQRFGNTIEFYNFTTKRRHNK